MNDVLSAIMKEEEYRKLRHKGCAVDFFTLKCWELLAHCCLIVSQKTCIFSSITLCGPQVSLIFSVFCGANSSVSHPSLQNDICLLLCMIMKFCLSP